MLSNHFKLHKLDSIIIGLKYYLTRVNVKSKQNLCNHGAQIVKRHCLCYDIYFWNNWHFTMLLKTAIHTEKRSISFVNNDFLN